MTKQRLQLTWYNKDMALIPTEDGKYGYSWVDPADPRYCETRPIVVDAHVRGAQSPKDDSRVYSELADLDPMDDNLMILGESGDVLEALTRVPELAKKYAEQVKLIYIDPPFNTEKTFASYEDNLEHSIWLTMMRDRLLTMRRLLRPDGSIWVHLDDSEVHRMRCLLDEVFGCDNYLAEVVWQKADSPRRGDGFSIDHDTILVYRKSDAFQPNKSKRTAEDNARFSNPDSDPNGAWWDSDPSGNHGDGSGGMCYAIQNPLTGEMLRPPKGRSWVCSQAKMFAALNEWCPYRYENLHDAEWRANNEGVPVEKASDDVNAIVLAVPVDEARLLIEARKKSPNWPEIIIRSTGGLGRKAYIPSTGNNPRTWWSNDMVGHNRAAKAEIKALFSGERPFDTPKPERLLERVIQIGSQPHDIVFDCFAGSGTTAAVSQKMGRRWLTCELLEKNFETYVRPRLTKVVKGEDAGGITTQTEECVPADGVELPDKVTPNDAAEFNRVLNKLIADDDELKKSSVVKQLKKLSKTKKVKGVINWRGGGGFKVAHLAPACFDYDPELDRVVLTPEATGDTLVRSVAANLGFEMIPETEGSAFDARRGKALLRVYEGLADPELVDDLVAQLGEGETLVLAATGVLDGTREHLRRARRGSRVVHVPDGIFSYSKEGDDE